MAVGFWTSWTWECFSLRWKKGQNIWGQEAACYRVRQLKVNNYVQSLWRFFCILYFEPFCVPCGRFFLWFNVPRGSYTGQRLMTGIIVTCWVKHFTLCTFYILCFKYRRGHMSPQSHCCFWFIFCNFCNFFWSLLWALFVDYCATTPVLGGLSHP